MTILVGQIILVVSTSQLAEMREVFHRPVERIAWLGADSAPVVRLDSKGAVVRLSPKARNLPQVGVHSLENIVGDFALQVTCEVQRALPVSRGSQVGVSLFLRQSTGETAALAWVKRSASQGMGDFYVCERGTTATDGEPGSRDVPFKPGPGKQIKLRLARKGATLTYSVAQGNAKKFRVLHSEEFGTAGISFWQFCADRKNAEATLEVRFLELSLQADALKPVRSVPPDDRRAWPPRVLGVCIPLGLLTAVWAARQRLREWVRPPGMLA